MNLAKQKENQGLLQGGMESDDSGGVSYTPAQQNIHDVQQQTALAQTMRAQNSLDPSSPESQSKRNFFKSTLNEVSPGFGDHTISDDMSGADLADQEPLMGHLFSGLSADAKARITAQSGYDKALMMAQFGQQNAQDKIKANQDLTDQKFKSQSDLMDQKLAAQADLMGQKSSAAADAAAKKAQDLQDAKDQAAEDKYQKTKTDYLQKINPANASIRTGSGTADVQLQNIQKLQQALKAAGGNPSQTQSTEIALGLQRVISGGTPNGEMASHLIPASMEGDINKMSAYIFNNPDKLQQQGFFKQSQDLANREQALVTSQLKQWQYPQLYSIENQIKNHEMGPNGEEGEWNEALKMNGVDPADYARYRMTGQVEAPQASYPSSAPKRGLVQPKAAPQDNGFLSHLGSFLGLTGGSSSQPAYTPDVIKYAKQHNISNEDALKIKQARSQ